MLRRPSPAASNSSKLLADAHPGRDGKRIPLGNTLMNMYPVLRNVGLKYSTRRTNVRWHRHLSLVHDLIKLQRSL